MEKEVHSLLLTLLLAEAFGILSSVFYPCIKIDVIFYHPLLSLAFGFYTETLSHCFPTIFLYL